MPKNVVPIRPLKIHRRTITKKKEKKEKGRQVGSWGLGLGLTHVTTPDARRLRQRFPERLLPLAVACEGVVLCFRCGK